MLGFGVRQQQMLNFILRDAQSIVQKAFRTTTLLTSGFLRVIVPNLNGQKRERRGVCACVFCVCVRACARERARCLVGTAGPGVRVQVHPVLLVPEQAGAPADRQ